MSVETAVPDRRVCPHCRALFRGHFARCPRDGIPLQPAVLDPLVGTTFAERYIIEDLLGEGAMGRVYRARHLRMSRRFAIKILFGDQSANSKMVARFTHEAEAASRVQHRNVVGVVDFGESPEGLLYLAMDYAAGPDLGVVIHRHGAMSSDRVLMIAGQLCEGLAHAHGRGLVHRDFKPENIILENGEEGDVARICDFGIAMLREGNARDGERLTTDGLVVGTPHYMAPEQSVGDTVDPRTDLFALGVIMYEMLAGKLPFEGTPAQVARMHLGVDPPPISVRVPGLAVDPLLEALAMRLMSKRPDDRPASARAVADLVTLIRTDRTEASRALSVSTGPGMVMHTEPMAQLTGRGQPSSPRAETVDERPRRSSSQDSMTVVDAPVARARRRRVLVIGATALGGVVLLAGVLLRGTPAPVAVVVDAGPVGPAPDRVAEVAVITELAPPDAAAVAIEVADAAEVDMPPVAFDEPVRSTDIPATRKRPVVRPAPPVAVPDKPVVTPPVKPAETAIPELTGSLSQRYRTVGRKIDELVHSHGENAAAPLKRRYLAIPIADAIRNPTVGTEVSAQLTALHRDVERALR